jgi:hypothetical protein
VTFNVVGANGSLAATVESVSIASGDLVVKGKNIEFTATSATGYKIKEWKLNGTAISGNTSSNYTLTNLSAAAMVSVEFEPITYAVTFNVVGVNGTIAATVESVSIASGDLVINGKNIEFTATPATGYKVKEWKLNGTSISGNTTSNFNLTNLSATTMVSVEFEPITHAVTFGVVSANGTISAIVDALSISSGAMVIQGKDVVFTATPSTNYVVKEWKVNNVVVTGNISNSYTLPNITAAAEISVEFKLGTGIDDNGLASVELYPNPFKSVINVKSNTRIAKLVISNIIGQVMNVINLNNCEGRIDTQNLRNGVYIIRTTDINGKISTYKLIKE